MGIIEFAPRKADWIMSHLVTDPKSGSHFITFEQLLIFIRAGAEVRYLNQPKGLGLEHKVVYKGRTLKTMSSTSQIIAM